MNDIQKLHSKGKQYSIGKDAPAEEQTTITLYGLSAEDAYLLEELNEHRKGNNGELSKGQLDVMLSLIAAMMRIDKEEVGKIDIEHLEEIIGCIEDRLSSIKSKTPVLQREMTVV